MEVKISVLGAVTNGLVSVGTETITAAMIGQQNGIVFQQLQGRYKIIARHHAIENLTVTGFNLFLEINLKNL